MPHYLCTNVLFICSSVLFHVLCIMYVYVNRQLNSREYDQLPHLILSQLMMMDFVVDGQVCAYVFFDTLSHRYTTFLDCVFVCRPIAILFFFTFVCIVLPFCMPEFFSFFFSFSLQKLCSSLLEVVDVVLGPVKCDIIQALPLIITDSEHEIAATHLK